MKKEEIVELLAPAGSPEGYHGAVNAGADAVYLGGREFGARAYADNFSEEELLHCLRHAHIFHKKIYLTVNTLVKEEELERLPLFLKPFVEEGLDGVIVQDFGVLRRIHEEFPELPLHASTQMNITGVYGARQLKRFGVSRIVPARELSLDEIRRLVQDSGMEVECFIHGAMCYSYSGQCLFSSILGGRSGNRGRCAQPCRLPYQIENKEGFSGKGKGRKKEQSDTFPLSLKDMCALELIPELVAAGVKSFKIEGRMKKPEYTAGVTAFYRHFLDLCLEGKWGLPSRVEWDKIRHLYIRSEVGTGYYHCRNGRNMITLDSPAYSGAQEKLLEEIRANYLEKKARIPVEMRGVFRIGEAAQVWIRSVADQENEWIRIEGDPVEKASKSPITKENLISQLSKLGDSNFELRGDINSDTLEIVMDEGCFYPLKKINELRRVAVNALEEALIHDR